MYKTKYDKNRSFAVIKLLYQLLEVAMKKQKLLFIVLIFILLVVAIVYKVIISMPGKIDNDRYEEFIKNYNEAHVVEYEIYPDYYGGMYYSNSQKLNINVTYLNDEIKGIVKEKYGDNIKIRKVKMSLNELFKIQNDISTKFQANLAYLKYLKDENLEFTSFDNELQYTTDSISGFGVSQKHNMIDMGIAKLNLKKILFFKEYFNDSNAIKFYNNSKMVINLFS